MNPGLPGKKKNPPSVVKVTHTIVSFTLVWPYDTTVRNVPLSVFVSQYINP
jgi:hypothetical protein